VSAVESGHAHPRCVRSEGKGRLVGDHTDHLDIGIVVTDALRILEVTPPVPGLFHKNRDRFTQGGHYLNYYGFRIRAGTSSRAQGVILQVMVSVVGEGGMSGTDETFMSGGWLKWDGDETGFLHKRGVKFSPSDSEVCGWPFSDVAILGTRRIR